MTTTMQDLDFATLWNGALAFDRFVAEATTAQDLWRGVYRQARLPNAVLEEAARHAPLKFLALVEDWCNDAVSTIPVLARLAEAVPGIELRLIRRDEHLDVMERYLSDGVRAIPIVIVLDRDCRELGHWGSRPGELQDWFLAHRTMPAADRNREIRRWYARDGGTTTIREVLAAACGGRTRDRPGG